MPQCECEAYLSMPERVLFRFGGVGATGQTYQKIDNLRYRRIGCFEERYELPTSFIVKTQLVDTI